MNQIGLTRRGKVVACIALALLAIGIYWVSTHLWWEGDGYCWGKYYDCYIGYTG